MFNALLTTIVVTGWDNFINNIEKMPEFNKGIFVGIFFTSIFFALIKILKKIIKNKKDED